MVADLESNIETGEICEKEYLRTLAGIHAIDLDTSAVRRDQRQRVFFLGRPSAPTEVGEIEASDKRGESTRLIEIAKTCYDGTMPKYARAKWAAQADSDNFLKGL